MFQADGYEGWQEAHPSMDVAYDTSVVEVRLALADLALLPGDTLGIIVLLGRDGLIEERHPLSGSLRFRLARQRVS
jgi:hypothetical protein